MTEPTIVTRTAAAALLKVGPDTVTRLLELVDVPEFGEAEISDRVAASPDGGDDRDAGLEAVLDGLPGSSLDGEGRRRDGSSEDAACASGCCASPGREGGRIRHPHDGDHDWQGRSSEAAGDGRRTDATGAPNAARKEGARRVKRDRRVRIGAGVSSKQDLWEAIGRAGWRIEGAEGIERYRELRRILVNKHAEHPREAALAALAVEGPDATKKAIFQRLGGTFVSIGPVMDVIAAELARPSKEGRRSLSAKPLSVSDFVAKHPRFAGLEGTALDREFKGGGEASAKLLGRVALMRSPGMAEMTGLMLLIAPGRIAESTADLIVRMLEKLDEVDADATIEGQAMLLRLRVVTLENVLSLPLPQRSRMVKMYATMQRHLRLWHDELPPARRAAFEELIPPALPPEFRSDVVELEEETAQQTASKRRETAEPISQDREVYLNVAELRFRQIDRLVGKVVADLRRISAMLEEGHAVQFPVTVSDTYHVVRAGVGGMGSGSQTIRVQVETAAELWSQCSSADMRSGTPPSHSVGWEWLSAERRQRLHPRGREDEPHSDGRSWSPALEHELKVVYVAMAPTAPGGEWAEPFWTSLFRTRLFDPDGGLDAVERSEREALVETLGFDPIKAPCPGLFADTSHRGKALARAYRRLVSRERFILPAEELRHAMAIGRAVMRAELMRGLRIGESSQARTDEGAFDFRKFDGRIFYYLSVVPKMAEGRARRMVLDAMTVSAFERVRSIAVERWFRAEGDMPVRAYHWKEKRLPDARYILANAERALIYAEMNLALRFLTLGVIGSSSHSYKYGFAAMMKRGNASDEVRRSALNHSGSFEESDLYERFITAQMVDEFVAEQQEESRLLGLDDALLEFDYQLLEG